MYYRNTALKLELRIIFTYCIVSVLLLPQKWRGIFFENFTHEGSKH